MPTDPLLAVLAPAERAEVTGRLVERSYRRGQVVFNHGDVGDALHLVRAGRFAVVLSNPAGLELIVRVVHPGEFFGELALVHPHNRRTGRIVALEPARTAVLHRRDFDELRALHPAVDRLLVVALAEIIKRMTEQAVEGTLPPAQRVWRRLGVLADAYGDEPVTISQDDLARMAGTVRQTVNRALATAEDAGAIVRRRGVIRVVDRSRLERLLG